MSVEKEARAGGFVAGVTIGVRRGGTNRRAAFVRMTPHAGHSAEPGMTLVPHFGHCMIYLHLPPRREKVGAGLLDIRRLPPVRRQIRCGSRATVAECSHQVI